MHFSPEHQQLLLDLARVTIRQQLGDASMLAPALDGDPIYAAPAGCFVTLHVLETHHLRGCLGRLDATGPLSDAVIEMAQAVLEDPRFQDMPVTLAELPQLELEITVLSPLCLAKHPTDFDLLEHGIYLRCDGHGGCFLPQVARETAWSREQLLERLCTEKMGLHPDAWRDPDSRLYRFTTHILGPEPFVPISNFPSQI